MDVILPLIIWLVFVSAAIAGCIWIVRATVRRTRDVGRPSIALGLATALATALIVFVLVYLSAWAEMRQQIASGRYEIRSRHRGVFLGAKMHLSEYASKHGRYPDSIENNPEVEDLIPLDPWSRPYKYEKTKDGFNLICFGRDGKPGGVGLDADVTLDEHGGPPVEPTVSQFLFEAEGGGTLLVVAVLASCFAGLACYLASGSQAAWPMNIGVVLSTFAIAAIGAVVVSLILVFVYLFGLPH